MCWCSWSMIPQPFERWQYWICANIENKIVSVARVWSENKADAMIWMIQAMWDYIVGLFPVLPILMQNIELLHFQIWWKKNLNWSIWHLTVQNSQFRCKRKIFFDGLLAKSGFSEENIDQHICWILTPVLKLNWCRKYCLLLPSWYLLPPILLSCYYMLCLFDRCNYLDFHTLVYSSNISVFLYIYSKGVWLFASQDIRLQCEIV